MKGLVIGIVLLMFAGLCNSVWASDKNQYDNPDIQNPLFWQPPRQPTGIVPILPEQPKSHDNAKKERIAPKTSKTPEPPAAASRPPRPERQDVSVSEAACQGEGCPGSGNTNPGLLNELQEVLDLPAPGNTMQFAFADGTQACLWSRNGLSGIAEAITQNTAGGTRQKGVDAGVIAMDNLGNWAGFQHQSGHSTRTCNPSSDNFCVYETDCATTLAGNYRPQARQYPSENILDYGGSIVGAGGICGSGSTGCYPDMSGPTTAEGVTTYCKWADVVSGTDPILPWTWEDTFGDATINPYMSSMVVRGYSSFSFTNGGSYLPNALCNL